MRQDQRRNHLQYVVFEWHKLELLCMALFICIEMNFRSWDRERR